MPNDPAPIPTMSRCSRLVGIELEFDAGNTGFRRPGDVAGWFEKTDGSLSNGREYVLEPALPFNSVEVVEKVKAFCDAANASRMNVCSSGGFHVHVQSPEFGVDECTRLALLYSVYQNDIDRLVAKSRHSNRFCLKFDNVDRRSITRMFRLDEPADNRLSAKMTRSTRVINFAMCRVEDPSQRSVEFRQGSPSKQFGCVWGWTALVAAMVEIASTADYDSIWNLESRATFTELLGEFERRTGASNLSAWVVWRDNYMNRLPTEVEIDAVVRATGQQPRGIFHVTRIVDIQIPLAMKALDEATSRGLVRKVGSKWISTRIEVPTQELEELQSLFATRHPEPVMAEQA